MYWPMANLITRALQYSSLRITYKLYRSISICFSKPILKMLLKECLYSHMDTLAYTLNIRYSSANKLLSLWKQIKMVFLLCWQWEQFAALSCQMCNPEVLIHFPRQLILLATKWWMWQKMWSKSHRPPSSLEIWVGKMCIICNDIYIQESEPFKLPLKADYLIVHFYHNFFVADAKFILSNYWQVALN